MVERERGCLSKSSEEGKKKGLIFQTKVCGDLTVQAFALLSNHLLFLFII